MPRFNVQSPDGKWGCFSTITDDFITELMPREEYDEWRRKEYGIHCGTIEESNIMEWKEASRILLCKYSINKALEEASQDSVTCNHCRFWNKELRKCEITERDNVILSEDF